MVVIGIHIVSDSHNFCPAAKKYLMQLQYSFLYATNKNGRSTVHGLRFSMLLPMLIIHYIPVCIYGELRFFQIILFYDSLNKYPGHAIILLLPLYPWGLWSPVCLCNMQAPAPHYNSMCSRSNCGTYSQRTQNHYQRGGEAFAVCPSHAGCVCGTLNSCM